MELIKDSSLWKTFLKSNDYFLCKSIGHGGFGDVFSATASNTGVTYAIKRLVSRRKIVSDQCAMREIKALMELDHPCIVNTKEVLLCDRLACIVMELASRGNLEEFAQNSTLSDVFVVRTFRQIMCAIEFCHHSDLAHRDINPSNVLLFDSGDVKIADFGLCFRCKDDSNDTELLCSDYLGRQTYLAPEVKMHQPFRAMPADVWSLGCVLLFLTVNDPSSFEEEKSNTRKPYQSIPNSDIMHKVSDCVNEAGEVLNTISDTRNDVYLYFAAQLKSQKYFKRPTISEALQKWTKLGGDIPK